MPDKQTPIDALKHESAANAKDPKTRLILIALAAALLISLIALMAISWNAYFSEKAKSRTLAQQIAFACENNRFGPGLDTNDEKRLCENADKVIENDDIPDGVPGPKGDPGSPGTDGSNGAGGTDGK